MTTYLFYSSLQISNNIAGRAALRISSTPSSSSLRFNQSIQFGTYPSGNSFQPAASIDVVYSSSTSSSGLNVFSPSR